MNRSSLTISPELLRYTSELDEFKSNWYARHVQSLEHLQMLHHVATIKSIGSSARIQVYLCNLTSNIQGYWLFKIDLFLYYI